MDVNHQRSTLTEKSAVVDIDDIFHDILYGKKCSQMNFKKYIFFQNFDFLRYFWHKDPKQALMPKVQEKKSERL